MYERLIKKVKDSLKTKKRVKILFTEYSGIQKDAANALRNEGLIVKCEPSGTIYVNK